MKRYLAMGAAAASWLAGWGWCGEPEAFQVTLYPEAAYRSERVTFLARGTAGTSVQAFLGERLIGEAGIEGETAELNVRLNGSGLLRVVNGAASVVFHVVQPEDRPVLRERDGYLHTDQGPAILLARHQHPRKHDRRWETARFLRGLVSDLRPPVFSGVIVGDGVPAAGDGEAGDGEAEAWGKFWTRVPSGNELSEAHGLLAGAGTLRPAGVLVVALSARDHERGMDTLTFRVKLEWYLQSLAGSRFDHIFLMSPLFDERQAERFADAPPAVELAARSHGGFFVDSRRALKGATSRAAWLRALRQEMEKDVKF